MASFPADLRYTKEHEWARVEGEHAVIGITQHAVDQLGDITYVGLPQEGDEVKKEDVFGSIESVKAQSDLFSPLSGIVTKVNDPLEDSPEYVNDDPYDEGWLIEIEIEDKAELTELMDVEAYTKYVAEEED
jgi:glycine cleavage system H protein